MNQLRKSFDIFLISETKIDSPITNAQFNIPQYRIFQKDRNNVGGGLLLVTSIIQDRNNVGGGLLLVTSIIQDRNNVGGGLLFFLLHPSYKILIAKCFKNMLYLGTFRFSRRNLSFLKQIGQ